MVVVFSMTGCVSVPSTKFKDDLDSLKHQVWSLEKQTAEVNLRLAQNNNEVALLGEKVKSLEEAVNSLRETIVKSRRPKIGREMSLGNDERIIGKVVSPIEP
ncbi:MAG: hypothetical protein OEY50_04220 [Nitrospinota bacterium]|nr:hypothetical protein [Nitrospinota bacterium]